MTESSCCCYSIWLSILGLFTVTSHDLIYKLTYKPLSGIKTEHSHEADLAYSNAMAVSVSEEIQSALDQANQLLTDMDQLNADPELKKELWTSASSKNFEELRRLINEGTSQWNKLPQEKNISEKIEIPDSLEGEIYRSEMKSSFWGKSKIGIEKLLARMKNDVKISKEKLKEDPEAFSGDEKNNTKQLVTKLERDIEAIEKGLEERAELQKMIKDKTESGNAAKDCDKEQLEESTKKLDIVEKSLKRAIGASMFNAKVLEWKFGLFDQGAKGAQNGKKKVQAAEKASE